MNNNNDTLIEFLRIIEYKGDNNSFADKFFTICLYKTLEKLSGDLSNDKKQELEEALSDIESYKKFQSKVNKYFDEKHFEKKFDETIEEELKKLVQKTLPHLSHSQIQQLRNLA